MKIAFITNNYEPITSGVTTSIRCYVESLRDIGHDVYIIAPRYPGHRDESAHVLRTASLAIYYKEKYPISIATPYSIRKLLRSLSIDIVHSHHPFGLGTTALRAVKQKLNIPIIFTYHTIYEDYSHYVPLPNGRYLKNFIKSRAIAYANASNLVICPTNFIKNDLTNTGCTTTIEVLPSPISRHLCSNSANLNRQAVLQSLGIPEGYSVLLCVSRLATEKNTEFLLRAYTMFLQGQNNSMLVITGEGPKKKDLISLARNLGVSDKVIFIGMISHSHLSEIYQVSDALLFCSKTETQGLPLTESLRFSLPIVAIESCAANELVRDQGCGMVTKSNEIDYAKGIAEMLSNQELKRRLRKRSAELAKGYSEEVLVGYLEDFYLRTIRHNNLLSESRLLAHSESVRA